MVYVPHTAQYVTSQIDKAILLLWTTVVEFYNTHSSVEIIPHLPLIKGGQIITAVPWV